MDLFREHEIFEIEVLEKMKSARVLEPLVFGGGTMLRLCHELNRYSADLDFWFVKNVSQEDYLDKIRNAFSRDYEITDSQMKHYSLLLELRSADYPKRLKVEIRREKQHCDYQEKIAFSKFSTRQVALRAHTLNQSMKNKIDAFLSRGEIRDCFDIEFLLRRGVEFPSTFTGDQLLRLKEKIDHLADRDFKVKLGSILESEFREFFIKDRFSFLKEKLSIVNTDT
jgi:hypothetical protein